MKFSVAVVTVLGVTALSHSFVCTRALSSTPSTSTTSRNAIVKNEQVPGLEHGMDYVKMGSSELVVSKVCMGTMTFGEQNTLEEGVEQLHKAWDEYGINFLDTAEMYPVPTKAESQGRTDRAIQMFLQQRGKKNRENIVLATKVCGRSDGIDWLPREQPKTSAALTRDQIKFSVDASLERLGTDYIDLLQLHWPDRYVGGLFGSPDFTPSQLKEETVSFEEQLSALQELVEEGKVRNIGVSNETPFGVCSFAEIAKHNQGLYPKIASIQNNYSLVVRKDFEAGLTEACHHHDVALLAYSPLAGGCLTGKYSDPKTTPEKARLNLFPGFMDRYRGSINEEAVNAYSDIAEKVGLTPAQLALSWCYNREFVCSTIIGATSIPQLEENIKAYDIQLDDDTLENISSVYKRYRDPTKM